jgi:hypothetical protein
VQGEKQRTIDEIGGTAAAEQDPKKFQALLVELNEMLQEKEGRLETRGNPAAKPTRE